MKDEVDKSRVSQIRIKITWLDHIQPMTYKSHNYDIIISFSFRYELRQTCRYRYECNLVKNLLIHWKTREKNRETNENILAP